MHKSLIFQNTNRHNMVFVLGNHMLWFDKLSPSVGAWRFRHRSAVLLKRYSIWRRLGCGAFLFFEKRTSFYDFFFMESNLYAPMLGWNSWNLVLCWWPTYAYLSCIIRLFFPFFSIFHFISGRTLSMIYYSLSWPHWLGGIVQRAEILAPLMQKKKILNTDKAAKRNLVV